MSTSSFNQFIDHDDLIGIPLGGPRLTWSDKWGSKFSKFDIFPVIEGLLDFSHTSLAWFLENKNLDHHPILRLEHKVDYGPYPFHLFDS